MSDERSQDPQNTIKHLKAQLQELHVKKEAAFQEKEACSTQIKNLISSMRTSKTERDTFTQEVREAKKKRDELNVLIRQKIDAIKDLAKKYPQQVQQPQHMQHMQYAQQMSGSGSGRIDKRRSSPSFLKKKIAELEMQIETGAISFTQEKKYMKQIHDLKKELETIKGSSEGLKEKHKLSKEIDALKKEAQQFHVFIQQKAGTSQQKHENMLLVSSELDTLRKKEKEAYEAFLKLKKEHNDLNNQLYSILSDMHIEQQKAKAKKEAKKQKKEEEQKKNLEERRQEVSEKLKKGKGVKLTTEDLIAFQGGE